MVTYINKHGKTPKIEINWENLHKVNEYEDSKREQLEAKLKLIVDSKKR